MSLVLEMRPLPKVSGRVLDAGGQPVKKFTVQLRAGVLNSDSSVKVEGSQKQFNSPDGSFELDCPRHGEFFVDAVAPGFAHSFSDPVTIAEGQNLPGVVVSMRKGGTIRGTVVDSSGQPIRNAWVQTRDNRWTGSQFDLSIMGFFPGVAVERRVRTNDKGEFSIDTLTPTTYLLEITQRNYSKTVVKDISVSEALVTDIKQATMFSGGTVAGSVRGPSGAPLAGAIVNMTLEALGSTDFPVSMQAKCDKAGKYSFEHVKAGTYWIHASRPQRGNSNPFGQGTDVTNTRRKISIAEGGNYAGEDFDISN
jgi:protocatechuate 3,4-dioxygenase beta subunit